MKKLTLSMIMMLCAAILAAGLPLPAQAATECSRVSDKGCACDDSRCEDCACENCDGCCCCDSACEDCVCKDCVCEDRQCGPAAKGCCAAARC
jgi:hypothetical protein